MHVYMLYFALRSKDEICDLALLTGPSDFLKSNTYPKCQIFIIVVCFKWSI